MQFFPHFFIVIEVEGVEKDCTQGGRVKDAKEDGRQVRKFEITHRVLIKNQTSVICGQKLMSGLSLSDAIVS